MKAKFVMVCVLGSIKIFQVNLFIINFLHELLGYLQIHGLKTSLLVCNGEAPNLAALKSTHGYFGAYGINAGGIESNHGLQIHSCHLVEFFG